MNRWSVCTSLRISTHLEQPHSLDPVPLIKRKPMIYASRDNEQVSRRRMNTNPLLVRAVVFAQVEEARAVEDVADLLVFVHMPESTHEQVSRYRELG